MFGQSLLSGAFGTALVPGDNFMSHRYIGTAANQSITALNFRPDLVWIKDRTTGYSHVLLDSLRGPDSEINSNDNTAEYTETNGLTAFTSNGFNLGNLEYSYNKLNDNYISWNWKAGADTYAGLFNGSSSLIAVGSPIPNTDTDVSISAWVKLDSGVSSNMHITGTGITSAGSEAPFRATLSYVSANTFKIFALRQVAGTYYLAGTGGLNNVTINASTWYHVVWSYNSTGRKLSTFLNGTAIDTDVAMTTSGSSVNDSSTVIGSFRSTSGPFFDGSIDQVRMFNTVLTQTQITSLYNETSGDNTTLNFPAGAGCIAAYTLDNTANDLSGNYNGTPSNIAYVKPGYTGRNNDGTIESQVSANQDAGFSIVKYIGNNTSGATIGHGLNALPHTIVVKRIDSTGDWIVYNNDLGATKYLLMNSTAGAYTASNVWNDTAPTSTVFSIGNYAEINTNAGDYIAYCWTSKSKYSQIGTYVGNGSSTGPIVSTGFRPTWIMVKRTDSTSWWNIQDNKRDPVNPRIHVLGANDASAEITSSNYAIDFNDNGFQILNSFGDWNASGGTYIYITFA